MKDKSNSHIVNALTHLISCSDIPNDPPQNPMDLFQEWFTNAEDCGQYVNPNAMTVATSTLDGAPSARIVLCKCLETQPPALVFFTSYESRKGREIEANPRAAAVFHWPHAKRQARVEGVVERVSSQESDQYFSSLPLITCIDTAREGRLNDRVRWIHDDSDSTTIWKVTRLGS